MKNVLRIIIKFLFKIIVLIIYRPKIIGRENIPKDGGALICPNHVHFLDSAVIIAMCKRKINVLAKEEIFKNVFMKFIANLFGIYSVNRNNMSIGITKISLRLLKKDNLLMIFPEATRNGMAKGIKPKNGAIKLAIKSGKPVIPVGIQGNFKLFKKVRINIGEPIYYTKYNDGINNKELLSRLTESLMNKVVGLRDE